MRFLLESVQNIRKKVGADYPLSVRLSGSEYQNGGIEIGETIEVSQALEKCCSILENEWGYKLTDCKQYPAFTLYPFYHKLERMPWGAATVIPLEKGENIIFSGGRDG